MTEVSVTIDPDGTITATINDEAGWQPETSDTMLRQARDTAVTAHRDLCRAQPPTT